MKLLYRTAEWHGLAKLRMHTESTLILLEELTSEFGKLLRQFRDLTCSQFSTMELPRETAARNRREVERQIRISRTVPTNPVSRVDPVEPSVTTHPAAVEVESSSVSPPSAPLTAESGIPLPAIHPAAPEVESSSVSPLSTPPTAESGIPLPAITPNRKHRSIYAVVAS